MSKVFTIAEGLQNLGALKTGGQGSVYKGMRMGPVYSAIKLIPTPIYTEDDSDKNYRNFLSEVTKLQQVNIHPSPNVVKILSSGITDSGAFPYIEMEYIDGPDLSELLLPPNQKIFTIRELLKVAEQLAAALAHCHKVDVKHGDLKSNNVKYNLHTGNYVLLDFGLAIMSEEQRRTSIRHAGAIEFMAPEQHDGKMLLQSDIYSYGIILYELLAGQVPFPLEGNGDTGRNTVMVAHLEHEIPDAMNLRLKNLENAFADDILAEEMKVPQWLLNLITRCLQKNPSQRFANGMELHSDVTNGLISNQDLAGNNSSFRKESHPDNLVIGEGKKRIENLERELSILRPLAKKAGIDYNEKTGDYASGNYIHAPRSAVAGLFATCIILIAILSYSLAPDKEPATPVTVTKTPYESPLEQANKQYLQTLTKLRQDSIKNAKMQAASKEKARAKSSKQKKKRKFLGIF